MKKTIINRITTIGFCAVFAITSLAAIAPAQEEEENKLRDGFFQSNPDVTNLPVMNMATGERIPSSGTTLTRERGSVFFTFHTQGLTPGHAVTTWMAVFNNPRLCATSPCTPADFANPRVNGTLLNSGGRIVGPDGAATFGGFRAVGDITGARLGIGTGNGLVNTRRAEIHLVVRTHGPANLADPAVLAEQLSMFNGGCPTNTCTNIQASIFMP